MIKHRHIKTILAPVVRFFKYRILHIDDSPHRIALGVALGVFIAYLPPFGIHIILAVLLSMLIRANKFAAVACVWLSNPLTIIPIYYPNYLLGRAVFSSFSSKTVLDNEQAAALLEGLSLARVIVDIGSAQLWRRIGALIVQIGAEIFVGGIIIGTVLSVGAYYATCSFVKWHRRNHPHHHKSGQAAEQIGG